MAKFCTRCGKPLVEGQVCECMSEQAQNVQQNQGETTPLNPSMAPQPEMQYQQAPAQANAVGDFFKKVYFTFINVLKAPATKGYALAASGDLETAFGLIGFQAIFAALFAMLVCSKINSVLGILSFLDVDIKIYMPTAFIVTLLISAVLSVIYALILLGCSLLFKNHITFKVAVSTVAVRSVIAIPAIVVAMIIFLLNPFYGMVVFYVGGIGGICYILTAFPVEHPMKKNIAAFIVFLSTVVFLFVAIFVMSKSAQFYVPSSVKSEVSDFLDNPSSIFEDMYSFY